MHFFAEGPSMLGGTQTFLATLATLIVLCLFRNDSNFLVNLISSLSKVLQMKLSSKMAQLQAKIEQAHKEHKTDQRYMTLPEVGKLHKLELKMKSLKNRFFNESSLCNQQYANFREQMEKRDEPRYMAIFMFVEIIAILTIDCFNVSQEAGAILLWVVSWFTALASIEIWKHYYREFRKYRIRMARRWLRVAVYSALAAFVVVVLFACMWAGLWLRIVLLLLASVVYMVLIHDVITYFELKDSLDDKFIVKYGMIIIAVCFAYWLIYSAAFFLDCISEYVEDYSCCVAICGWYDNVDAATHQISWARSTYIGICVANAFMAPLVIAYWRNSREYHKADNKIEELFTSILAEITPLSVEIEDAWQKAKVAIAQYDLAQKERSAKTTGGIRLQPAPSAFQASQQRNTPINSKAQNSTNKSANKRSRGGKRNH